MKRLLAVAALSLALLPGAVSAAPRFSTQVVTATVAPDGSGNFDAVATCPPGTAVTGGGWSSAFPPPGIVVISRNAPTAAGWEVAGGFTYQNPGAVTVYGVCGGVF